MTSPAAAIVNGTGATGGAGAVAVGAGVAVEVAVDDGAEALADAAPSSGVTGLPGSGTCRCAHAAAARRARQASVFFMAGSLAETRTPGQHPLRGRARQRAFGAGPTRG